MHGRIAPSLTDVLRFHEMFILDPPEFRLKSGEEIRGDTILADATWNSCGLQHTLEHSRFCAVLRCKYPLHMVVAFPCKRFSFARMEMFALSKREIRQVAFARSVASMKSHCLARGTTAMTSKWIWVIVQPAVLSSMVTVAVVSTWVG